MCTDKLTECSNCDNLIIVVLIGLEMAKYSVCFDCNFIMVIEQ